jgi:hypothetical protein
VSRWLTDGWFDEARALAAGLPRHPGVSARIRCEVIGGSDGDRSFSWVITDGAVVEVRAGAVEDPDVTLTAGWEDAMAVQRGELDPSAAFMQGRMKVSGSMAVMMVLLPLTRDPAYQDLVRRVAEVTEF